MSKYDSNTGTESYTYDNANRLLTRNSNSCTNDLNGNTLTGGGRTNTWDVQNRLVQCVSGGNTTTFTYGADGLRRSSTSGGVTTRYALDGQSVVRELRQNEEEEWVTYATYLTGLRGPEYRRDADNNIKWYLYDGLGSVVGELDNVGQVTYNNKLDVYGAVRASTGTSTSKHKFVGSLGHVSEDSTGLIYMRARYMDPTLGRFISEDPAGDGVNWFNYCSNNPVNFVDESGKKAGEYIGEAFSLWFAGFTAIMVSWFLMAVGNALGAQIACISAICMFALAITMSGSLSENVASAIFQCSSDIGLLIASKKTGDKLVGGNAIAELAMCSTFAYSIMIFAFLCTTDD